MAKTGHLHAVDATTVNGVVTARIIGPAVEEHRGNAILETVGRAIEEAADSVRALVLDFGNVTFINSSGIACFIRLCNGLKEKGIRTIIYRPGANLGDIFREMKLDKMFEFVETPDDLKAVLAPEGTKGSGD
ncbi:MAG: STAS domain-containing protein [Planctomycetes bacterium]|nr:STAS domain-containing protein [Planctomycetota bacterium]